MALFQILVIIVVVGVLLWAVNSFVPMDAKVKQVLNVVVIIALVLWLAWWLLALAGLNRGVVPTP